MLITAASLTALRKGFTKDYEAGLEAAKPDLKWQIIARRRTSTQRSEVAGWLSGAPPMRKWEAGDRVVRSMKEHGQELENDEFESTVGVLATDIKDDRFGLYSEIMEEMGGEGMLHIDRGCYAALKEGHTAAALISDGKNFFASDHPVYAEVDGTGASTPFSNIYTPTDTTGAAWFLIRRRGMAAPVIYQDRERLRFDAYDDPSGDSRVFLKKEFLYGIYARRAFGYWRWQTAIRSQTDITRATFDGAFAQMMEFKRDGLTPVRYRPTTLVIPPELRSAALDVVETQRLANGQSNPNYKIVEIHVEELLS